MSETWDEQFRYQHVIPRGNIQAEKIGWMAARRKMGEMLMDMLPTEEWYAVCIMKSKEQELEFEKLNLWLEIRAIPTKYFIMPAFPNYELMPITELSMSAIDEIKKRIKRIVKRK